MANTAKVAASIAYLAAALIAFAPAHLGAQQPSAAVKMQPIGYKDPELATILGVVLPGGGQFYAGRTGKGALLLAGSVGSALVAVNTSHNTCDFGTSWTACGSAGAEAVAMFAAVGFWAYGWLTAGRDARLHNEERLNGTSSLSPFLERRNGRTLAGLALSPR